MTDILASMLLLSHSSGCDKGNATLISHIGNGEYEARVNGEVGTTYTLTVRVGNNTYVASSTMLEKVEIVDIEAEFQSGGFIDDDGYEVLFRYNGIRRAWIVTG